MLRLVTVSVVLVAAAMASAEPLPAGVRAHAARRTGSISIDGKLNEPVWAAAERQSGFIQRFPKDGVKASHDTQFALLYDDDAIYVAVWADDPEPQKIRRLLTRRDVDVAADVVILGIDSYHDRRTAYAFQLNAAGVQRDMLLFDDVSLDDTWDAVWTGDAAVNEHGWTAEFRIPLNQLRFSDDKSQEWGLQILRKIGRTQEESTWAPWPRAANGFVSRFGVVDRIDNLKPSRRLELLPYASGGVQTEPIEEGDPLTARSSALGNIGLDLKYGLGPAFTLSATINPDFGQVEADPSQVNLSANELFFAEKRPFFIEGVDLFKLPIGSGSGLIEGAFYSRRIGAAPDEPDLDFDYIDAPSSTTIYSAAKLTGKTRNGWSVGLLDAVTGEEKATIADAAGMQASPIVAALTNYAVGRVKRDLRMGKSSIGLSATAVNRQLDGTPLAELLHDQAYTAGAQLTHRWDDNKWEMDLHGVGSWVHGTEAAISNTQQLNRHLYQRPDASHVHLDETRTSLGGGNFDWYIGRSGETKHYRWALGGDLRTPGLELNDAGFQFYSDRLENWIWAEYRDEEPTDSVLNWRTEIILFEQTTLEPELVTYGANWNINTQLTNYWSFFAGAHWEGPGYDPIALRGGAALRTEHRYNGSVNVATDSRKDVRFELGMNGYRDPTMDTTQFQLFGGATIQAASNIDIFLGPNVMSLTDPLQYVDQVDDTAGVRHYIFGRIQQTQASLTARLNWTFSPKLSLQVYAQPFVSAGKFSELKDVNNPRAKDFEDRFVALDGTEGLVFDDPDFNIGELRSTMVLRWEYRPGSAVFAIWSHGRTNEVDSAFRPTQDLVDLARTPGENIVMVKANYWIGL
ncbi:MAG: carbohydrate binding family 9 domain-containing protein [Kofleriaceae bacterium]|nr:carbohydrate binding family 9 domain-containing protein [Kofleriaceae bacterium]